MFRLFFLRGLVCVAALTALLPAGSAQSQGYPADGCLPRREAIATVLGGRAMPLRHIRGTAEQAARGEMINAELCFKGGQLVYVVTVLSTTGKVVYVSLNAANGQVIGTR
jgi:uncharacterized membrane protein YkoI